MYWYSSGICITTTCLFCMAEENCNCRISLCLSSITKTISAHKSKDSLTLMRADEDVPADFAVMPETFLYTVSAVGLRHWLRLQMNRIFNVLPDDINIRSHLCDDAKCIASPYFARLMCAKQQTCCTYNTTCNKRYKKRQHHIYRISK